jgi:D-proline reductase (dithiol) PrdB
MREKEEGKNPGPRRPSEDVFEEIDKNPAPVAAQSMESLREGYSWIHALETRYPGWHLQPVEGFPFAVPAKKLSESKVCLVSLAGVYRKGQKPFNTTPGMVPAPLRAMRFKDRGDWSFREITLDAESMDLAIAHAHYDTSEADEDINCIFPMIRLVELEVDGCIGECANVHYALMGFVPEAPLIVATAAKEIIPRLKAQQVDVALVCGGCELSHQSAGLIQREIETAGIATVGISVCPDITARLLVPRAVALRFPLGSPFGVSMDVAMQLRVLRDALSLIDTATTPGEVVRLPYDWVKTYL